jgi:ABC-type amino acid transport substrate-binding protein
VTRGEQEPILEPKVVPPVIDEAGVLRVGVDLRYPPFAGTDADREAGIDVDVADALAAELGLAAEIVAVEPTRVADALAEDEIDVAMSVPIAHGVASGASIAGSYIADGPAFFVSVEDTASVVETITVGQLGRRILGAQDGSRAFWLLEEEFGEGHVKTYPTLRGAIEGLVAGEFDVLAADALVAAYIARDFETVRFAGQVEPATQLGAAVAADSGELEQAVRTALDTLAAQGVLDTVRTKWVGDLPELAIAAP